jgi:outer membrane protein insertion porin family
MRLTFKTNLLSFWCISLFLVVTSSCSVLKIVKVKDYQANKPFVYENKITLSGNVTKDEKKRLTEELDNYWDDSLKARTIQQFAIIYKTQNPAVFDSANISRSINFMNAYLNSQGYYYAMFSDSVKIDTVKDQLRTTIHMFIDIGKNITIDSVSYNLGDTTLQHLTDSVAPKTFLKKGSPYTKESISSELDRLVGTYRENGYYKFTREDIYTLVDSMDTRLLQLTLDPFKQAQIIADAARLRKENPTWDINVLKRPTFDSSKLYQYHIGRVYYYPETKLSDIVDSLPNQKGFLELNRRNLTMRYKKGLFNYRVLREHTYLRNGELYRESDYFKTVNTLGQIGAWQQVDGKAIVRDRDTLDLHFFLTPAIKQNYGIDLEGSRNSTDVLLGNLWGFTTNLTYNNRNVWKSAIQSLTSLRTGVELNLLTSDNAQLLQTFLISASHSYVFPKLVQPFKNWRALNRLDNKRTLFNINGSYVDRRNYYQLRSLVTSWGYEWKKNNNVWLYKPVNLELYAIDTLDKLRDLFKTNPFLRNSFQSGKVLSQSMTLLRNYIDAKNPDKSHYLRLGVEEAGGLFGLIGNLKDDIYRYIKLEAEYRLAVKVRKTEFAYRVFGGLGYNYGDDPARDQTLPFFKQFYAGGPYSMRAWGLRQLGLGSSIVSDSDTSQNGYRDRFGDMQLEGNFEYRFPIATVAGIKVASALFADIGNIWNLKNEPTNPDARFSFKNLGKDLAIAVGTGMRIDFSYFLVRLDFAYKVKDPARLYNNGWADKFQWFENRANGLKVNNYAVQLGIGLPF